jgi:hypothetical protein
MRFFLVGKKRQLVWMTGLVFISWRPVIGWVNKLWTTWLVVNTHPMTTSTSVWRRGVRGFAKDGVLRNVYLETHVGFGFKTNIPVNPSVADLASPHVSPRVCLIWLHSNPGRRSARLHLEVTLPGAIILRSFRAYIYSVKSSNNLRLAQASPLVPLCPNSRARARTLALSLYKMTMNFFLSGSCP